MSYLRENAGDLLWWAFLIGLALVGLTMRVRRLARERNQRRPDPLDVIEWFDERRQEGHY